MLYCFSLPIPERIIFEDIIKSSSKEELRQLSTLRNRFIDVLLSTVRTEGSVSYEGAIAACEAYLPYLYSLDAAFQGGLDFKWFKSLKFEWRSGLDTPVSSTFSGPKQREYEGTSVRMEVRCMLMCYGMLLCNQANHVILKTLNDSDFANTSRSASLLLRKAAGVFEHVAVVEGSVPYPMPEVRPPEVIPPVAKAISFICLALANELAARNAVMKNMSASLTAKLWWGVYQKWDLCGVELSQTLLPMDREMLNENFMLYVKLKAALSRVMAFKYLAQDAKEKEQHGVAVGYITLAQELITAVNSEARSLVGPLVPLITEEHAIVSRTAESYKQDNNMVYFQIVPSKENIELPEAKSVSELTPFVEPTALFRSLG